MHFFIKLNKIITMKVMTITTKHTTISNTQQQLQNCSDCAVNIMQFPLTSSRHSPEKIHKECSSQKSPDFITSCKKISIMSRTLIANAPLSK